MFFLTFIRDIIKVLRSNGTPGQIGAGFMLGFMAGITPFWSLWTIFLWLIIIVLNVNLTAAIFAYGIASLAVFLFDPLFHDFGYWLLTGIPALKPLWTTLYNLPVIPYTSFNNTVNLGSILISLVAAYPLYLLIRRFIITYREKYEARILRWKWVKWMKATPAYEWYARISALRDRI